MAIDTKQDLKQAVLEQLEFGKEHAVTGAALARRLGEPGTRAMRIVMRELVKEGYLVTSSPSSPPGYYLANNAEEAREHMAFMKSYLIEEARRLRDYKLAARALLNPHQLTLKI